MKFLLKWDDLPTDVRVGVLSFDLRENLCAPYEMQLDIVSTSAELDLASLPSADQTASLVELIIGEDGQVRSIPGHLVGLTFRGEIARGVYHYTLEVRGKPYLCDCRFGSQVFQELKPAEIVEQLLLDAGYMTSDDFGLKLQRAGDYAAAEFRVQHQLSDLQYLHGLLREEGIFYYQDFSSPGAPLVFADANPAFAEIEEPMVFAEDTGTVAEQRCLRRLVRRVHSVAATYRAKPGLPVSLGVDTPQEHELERPALGVETRYGGVWEEDGDGKRYARVMAEQSGLDGEVIEGVGDRSDLFAGARIVVTGHPKPAMNGDLYVFSVVHRGNQPWPWHANASGEHEVSSASYTNQFLALPDGVPYRPRRRPPGMELPGVVSALVDGQATRVFPDFNEETAYRMRLPFDQREEAKPGGASNAVPVIRPFAGPKGEGERSTGWHLPVPKGTTGIVGTVQGDFRRSVLLGTLPSSRYLAPAVDSADTVRHQFSTPGGQSQLFVDRAGTGAWVGEADDPKVGSGFLRYLSATNRSAVHVGEWETPENQEAERSAIGVGFSTDRLEDQDAPAPLASETMNVGRLIRLAGDEEQAVTEGIHWSVDLNEQGSAAEWTLGRHTVDDVTREGLRMALRAHEPFYTTLWEMGQLEAEEGQDGIKLSCWLSEDSAAEGEGVVIPDEIPDQFFLLGKELDCSGATLSTRQNIELQSALGIFLASCQDPAGVVELINKVDGKAWDKLESKTKDLSKVDSGLGSKLGVTKSGIEPYWAGVAFDGLSYDGPDDAPPWYGTLERDPVADVIAERDILLHSNLTLGLSCIGDVDLVGQERVSLTGLYRATFSGAGKGVGMYSVGGPVYALSVKGNASARAAKGSVFVVSQKETALVVADDSKIELSSSDIKLKCKDVEATVDASKVDLKASSGMVGLGAKVASEFKVKAKDEVKISGLSAGLSSLKIELG